MARGERLGVRRGRGWWNETSHGQFKVFFSFIVLIFSSSKEAIRGPLRRNKVIYDLCLTMTW